MRDACVRRPREFELVSHASLLLLGAGFSPCRPWDGRPALSPVGQATGPPAVASPPGIRLKIKNFTERSLSLTAWATGACRPQMGDGGLFLQFIETAIYF